MNKIRLTIILTLFSALYTAAYGQVTIGSNNPPNNGALLDLNDQKPDATDNTTAKKGMMLPRVNLLKLKPESGSTDLKKTIEDATGDNWDLNAHIGLTVYNVKAPDQCASDPIPTGVFTWTGTEWEYLGENPFDVLVPGVTYHEGKQGVYEGFYSAWFGDPANGGAGRWMTTNLTAWKYEDGISHPATNKSTLILSASSDYSNPYYCYPNGASSQPSTWNSQQGLLYNWSAATAGKGGITGEGNTTNEGASNSYPPVQGICPNGWHLPSDYEWTVLENAIIKNTSDYANMANISTDGLDFDDTSGLRGSTHGQAMKTPCVLNGYSPNGKSKSVQSGGFNALLVGDAYMGNAFANWGKLSGFWTVSSFNDLAAWFRYLAYGEFKVFRGSGGRTNLYSIRCKKD